MTPKSIQNHLKIDHFCLLFGSWAAPGASQSDFGRSQNAPGALWELFEIITSLQNRHFDALGRSWDPPGPPRAPQERPKTPKWSQKAPKMLPKWQKLSKILPKCFQTTSKIVAKLSPNHPKIIPKSYQNCPKIKSIRFQIKLWKCPWSTRS